MSDAVDQSPRPHVTAYRYFSTTRRWLGVGFQNGRYFVFEKAAIGGRWQRLGDEPYRTFLEAADWIQDLPEDA